jgi:hypothetical protein
MNLFVLMFGTVFLGTILRNHAGCQRHVSPLPRSQDRRLPNSGQIAEVELTAKRAALLSAIHKHWVHVNWCSLWPKQRRCAENCLKNLHDRRKGNRGE